MRNSSSRHRRSSPIYDRHNRNVMDRDHSKNPEMSTSTADKYIDAQSIPSSDDSSPSSWPCNLGSSKSFRDCFRHDSVVSDDHIKRSHQQQRNKSTSHSAKANEDKTTQTKMTDKNTRASMSDEDIDDNEVEDILSRISQRKYRSGQQILVSIGKERYLSPISNSTLTTPPSIRTTQSDSSTDGAKTKLSKHLKGQCECFR